ncbi:MAG TPA: flagellar biosynthesis anti-sigma factor FlgM [Halanaerobiales bacterium]|nr:flagellar biosynthesis anti-sigma factor FlgM [Halanaerobiales bacterium]
MKINHLQMEKIQQIYLKEKRGIEDLRGRDKTDSMKISGEAMMIREMEKRVAELPEIREERVIRLKELIRKGEYSVDSRAIADKILSGIEQE